MKYLTPYNQIWVPSVQRAWHKLEADGISEMSLAVVIVNEQKGKTRQTTSVSPF